MLAQSLRTLEHDFLKVSKLALPAILGCLESIFICDQHRGNGTSPVERAGRRSPVAWSSSRKALTCAAAAESLWRHVNKIPGRSSSRSHRPKSPNRRRSPKHRTSPRMTSSQTTSSLPSISDSKHGRAQSALPGMRTHASTASKLLAKRPSTSLPSRKHQHSQPKTLFVATIESLESKERGPDGVEILPKVPITTSPRHSSRLKHTASAPNLYSFPSSKGEVGIVIRPQPHNDGAPSIDERQELPEFTPSARRVKHRGPRTSRSPRLGRRKFANLAVYFDLVKVEGLELQKHMAIGPWVSTQAGRVREVWYLVVIRIAVAFCQGGQSPSLWQIFIHRSANASKERCCGA